MKYFQRKGTAKPSLARDNLLAQGDMNVLSESEQDNIKNVTGTLYEGILCFDLQALLPPCSNNRADMFASSCCRYRKRFP